MKFIKMPATVVMVLALKWWTAKGKPKPVTLKKMMNVKELYLIEAAIKN